MRKPTVLAGIEARAREVMDRNNSPVLSTEEACEILGCTPESLLNSAENNCLPFGFMHRKGETYRRNVVIVKLALWNWLEKENC